MLVGDFYIPDFCMHAISTVSMCILRNFKKYIIEIKKKAQADKATGVAHGNMREELRWINLD